MPAASVLPAPLPPLADLEVSTAGGGEPRCTKVTTSVRAAAITLADVSAETRAQGVPGDWAGLAGDTAGCALAAFARESDVVTVALEWATSALDVYAEQMLDLDHRHALLEGDRGVFNRDLDALRLRVESAGAVEPEVRAGLDDEVGRLERRRRSLLDDVTAWSDQVQAAEDRVIGVLRSVDTDAEARSAAEDPHRPDVDALREAMRGVQDDPRALHGWWRGLSEAQREALKTAFPHLVGSTDGIPVRDRDDVNRAALERDLDHLRRLEERGIGLGVDLDDEERRRLEEARETQKALTPGGLTDPATGEPVRPFLLLYDPDAFGGDGRGAVAYGDPDTADNTVVLVPGLTTDLTDLDSLGEDARNVYSQAATSGETPAVIAWVGYDAPDFRADSVDGLLSLGSEAADVGGVATEQAAEDGGHHLVDFVDGLRATDEGPQAHVTVVGHSYGSTAAAHGAADGLDADDLVLLGSPGAGGGVSDAAGLGLAPGHVFVGAADNDPVTWLGGPGSVGLGQDPAQDSFGGTRFDVDPGAEFGPTQVGSVGFQQNHGSYYEPGSESLHNIGAVVNGDRPDVVDGRHEPAREHLYDWVRDQTGITWVDEHVVSPLEDGLRELGGLLDPGRGGVGSW